MRGVVLLLDANGFVDPDLLRANGLMVSHASDLTHALIRLEDHAPDVIVTVLSPNDSPSLVSEFRDRADHATSIIVISSREQGRQAARESGADAFLLTSADLLYEVHRALILRRSGRRLPWNW